ncbi:putative amidohydrolase YtcJ [Catenulispora sp. GP43]|uniref:amidohydrolase n=1 Tax=Catenulispora sp. GP43 TaxID=3156263 RepID=UPI00351638C9
MSTTGTEASAVADSIYFNGQIITMAEPDDDSSPRPEAVAVRGETIVFVGELEDAERDWRGPATVMRDLEGRTLLPGFIDPHSHLGGIGLQATVADLLAAPDGDVGRLDDVVERLSRWRDANPPYGPAQPLGRSRWIIGFGYDDAIIGGHPTRQDLDRVSTTRPVLAIHQSFHLGAVNTVGLQELGMSADTPDPKGGVIRREDEHPEHGTPSGVLEEAAFTLANTEAFRTAAADGRPANFNPLIAAGFFKAGRAVANRFGFTTVQEGGTTPEILAAMRSAGAFPLPPWQVDVVVYISAAAVGDADLGVSRDYVRGLRCAGVKMFLDGSPQGRTAWLTEPYKEPPDDLPCGYPAIEDFDVVVGQVRRAFANDWQVIAHVNGDAAIDQYIAAIEAVCAELGEPDAAARRPVAIHAQTAREDQLEEFARLGIIPSFFSMHTFYWGDWYQDVVLGSPRAENISPAASALAKGLRYTSHHDAPVALPDSIRVLSSQVTRRTRGRGEILGEDQRVSVRDALRSLTVNAAYQYFEEHRKGTIEVGKQADLVVLNHCPLDFEDPYASTEWARLKVVETIRRGVRMPFEAADALTVDALAAEASEEPVLVPFRPAC